MVIGDISDFGHEDSIQIGFMLLVDDVNDVVMLVVAVGLLPDSSVDVSESECLDQTIVIVVECAD
jgi:hypothetical protein